MVNECLPCLKETEFELTYNLFRVTLNVHFIFKGNSPI
jgi:hypothetical protein